MRHAARRPGSSRRGVTLLEMMVTVALLVLIMTIVVQIFGSATGAMSSSRAYQELDQGLRRLDVTIRSDLDGVTARFTPPLDPKDNLGYFEYAENAFADNQGEDADDYLRFTAKAPEGRPFTGRVIVGTLSAPILITSQYAEVIYFLRNGNLYRRVLLIAPERQSSLSTALPTDFHGTAPSWQSMNDLSAHPAPSKLTNPITLPLNLSVPILNTLGDTTNRENRPFTPRFFNDNWGATDSNPPDGIVDDLNRDGVPDYYPTLYPNSPWVNEDPANPTPTRPASYSLMPFPYIFPGAYSRPAPGFDVGQGWIHSLDPSDAAIDPTTDNQAPLELGDSAPAPGAPGGLQTWWGFPTWRETIDADWTDPFRPATAGIQAKGLEPFNPTAIPPETDNRFLPQVTRQPFRDNAGSNTFDVNNPAIWDDDLIMTGVRSFDVKAYDNSYGGYVDLGWGDDPRIANATRADGTTKILVTDPVGPGAFLVRTPIGMSYNGNPDNNGNPYTQIQIPFLTYAHEGRIPPLEADFRPDPQAVDYGRSDNVGDDDTSVIRLRRVWDSWSTTYTRAPHTAINPTTKAPARGLTAGFPPSDPRSRSVYPSYPPPYPLPLRGIQIQIRVVDPRSEYVKVLTIRQDFSDKL